MTLEQFGWDDYFQAQFHEHAEEGVLAGRVAQEHRRNYRLYTTSGELDAEVTGRMRFDATSRADLPAVGDWVVFRMVPNEKRGLIHAVLPRRSAFSRKVAGEKTEVQIVAANVDTIFLISGLDQDFNLRRLERYLTLAWESGASPAVILNKSDLCEQDVLAERLQAVEEIAFGSPVESISALEDSIAERLLSHLPPGKTGALLGSSGVGKSTILNNLMGKNVQDVQAVREHDSRGRHTTSHRELFILPSGALMIDTPGMRELQLWEGEAGIYDAFEEIAALAAQCHFRDCSHQQEPDCAVREAVEAGQLPRQRYESFLKLQRELQYIERQQDVRLAHNTKKRWKSIHKEIRQRYKGKR